MACLDQLVEPGIALRRRLEIVPGGDVQGGDPGLAPAAGEIVEIDAEPVGGVEEGPEARRAERRIHAEVGEGVQKVRESFVAVLAGRRGHP